VCAETGRVYAFGSNKFGELGLGHNISTTTPTSPEALKDSIYKVACGRYHSACTDCKETLSCSLLIIRICRTILVCLFGWLVFFVCLLQNMRDNPSLFVSLVLYSFVRACILSAGVLA